MVLIVVRPVPIATTTTITVVAAIRRDNHPNRDVLPAATTARRKLIAAMPANRASDSAIDTETIEVKRSGELSTPR
jgi:hypothetical protein